MRDPTREERVSLELSGNELAYLKDADFLPEPLLRTLEMAQHRSDGAGLFIVARAVAEQFRSAFTDHLAKVGFGADYELTSEGKFLEVLIDRFFLGKNT